MNMKKVREGKVELIVPDVKIPEDGREYGFYNPVMRFDRNISVAVLKVFREIFERKFGNEPKVLDALTATGVRGIRYAKEDRLSDVTINDINPKAIEVARKNVELNEVKVRVMNEDANKILTEESFDVIDIDPFGSPYRFVDSTARACGKLSLVCITATDLPVLFGIYPNVCLRRYGAKSLRCQFERELGLRILLSFLIREFSKYDLAFQPVLSYSKKHWMRIFAMVKRSSEKSIELMKKFECLNVEGEFVGHVYLGPLKSHFFLKSLIDELKKRGFEEEEKFVKLVDEEINNPFYFDLTWISKKYKKKIPKVQSVVDALKSSGFAATRTHFSPTGVKTTATFEEVLKIVEGL